MPAKVVIHPAPAEITPSPDYEVSVDGRSVFVYYFKGMADGGASFVSFDFTGEVEVAVTSLWQADSVEVHPVSSGIQAELRGDTAVLAIAALQPVPQMERPL